MHASEYTYKDGTLFVEGVSVAALAGQFGTPLYVYSAGHFRKQYAELAGALAGLDPLICYSVKANSNGGVIRTFAGLGAGVDVVSGGELFRARRAGVPAGRIVYAGVGKTVDEIHYALKEGILCFTVESEPEAERISACAVALGRVGRIAFRINPDVDPRTHKYTSTGKKENKFGLDIDRFQSACDMAARLPGIEVVGLHMHIGSQILSAQPFVDALAKVLPLCRQMRARFPAFAYLDIGGGIGICYEARHEPLTPAAFAAAVRPLLADCGLKLIMEPGRFLVGNGGMLVSRVQYVKDNPVKKFVIVDAGMNDLIRPSLYGAYQEIVSVTETPGRLFGDVVGPICESGDFLAQERELPAVAAGDLVAVLSAGAYGAAMGSSYNSRPRPPEVMVDGNRVQLLRRRETWEDLVMHEVG